MYEVLLAAIQVIIVIMIPFTLNRIVQLILYKTCNELSQIPILNTLARLQGILAGSMLVFLDFDKQYFDIEQVFLLDGPWNITLFQFLFERANVFSYDPIPMITLLTSIHDNGWLMANLAVIGLPLALLILNFTLWDMDKAIHALPAIIGVALWSGWLTVYLISAVFWALHLMNFWSLVLLALYLQYRGNKSKTLSWWF
jgi:hypothetical protein